MKALVFSLDAEGTRRQRINKGNTGDKSVYTYLWNAEEGEVKTSNAGFASKQFHVVTLSKIEAALAVMKLGYDVFFMDTDVALLQIRFPICSMSTTCTR